MLRTRAAFEELVRNIASAKNNLRRLPARRRSRGAGAHPVPLSTLARPGRRLGVDDKPAVEQHRMPWPTPMSKGHEPERVILAFYLARIWW